MIELANDDAEKRAELIELATSNPTEFIDVFVKVAGVDKGDFEDSLYDYRTKTQRSAFGITLTVVHSIGGGEGGGETVVRVFAVNADGKVVAYLKRRGFYSSYEGTEWNAEFTQTFPRYTLVVDYANKLTGPDEKFINALYRAGLSQDDARQVEANLNPLVLGSS